MALAEHITASSWGPDERPDFFILEGGGDGGGDGGGISHKESERQRTRLYMMYLCHLLFLWKGNHLCGSLHEDSREDFVGGRGLGEERTGKSFGFGIISLYIPRHVRLCFLVPVIFVLQRCGAVSKGMHVLERTVSEMYMHV